MAVRHNTIFCSFYPAVPRIAAYEIREWIYNALWIPEHKISMIQTDGIKRRVFIKMVDTDSTYPTT